VAASVVTTSVVAAAPIVVTATIVVAGSKIETDARPVGVVGIAVPVAVIGRIVGSNGGIAIVVSGGCGVALRLLGRSLTLIRSGVVVWINPSECQRRLLG